MLWGVGVDQIRTPFGRWMIKHWIARANVVTVRDHRSYERLRVLGFREDKLFLAADPVFEVPRESRCAGKQFVRELLGIDSHTGPVVLLSPSNDRTVDVDYLSPLVHGCRQVIGPNGGKIVLFLMDHQPRYDLTLLARAELRADGTVMHAPVMSFSAKALPLLFAGVDAVVASRMHALILAASQGTPWINVSRGAKMDALGEMFQRPPLRISNLTTSHVARELSTVLAMGPEGWQSATDAHLKALQERAAISRNLFEELISLSSERSK
jgi:polysaccharide pyruvyl transferase WcaK-like protein